MVPKLILGAVAMIAAAPAVGAAEAMPAQQAVQQALDQSAAAWTAGRLDDFMTLYERDPATSYVSSGQVITGYEAIRARYAARFAGASPADGPVDLGVLTLEVLDFRALSPTYVFVLGRYHLKDRKTGEVKSGPTTLLFRRGPAGWKIISDHTG
ncbi:nuclear transport factor 2 family protein [Phenylobacterium sp. LjRoot225]|uniref:YybH family protein n=1 Tax=Phenylobacterium sp. LjRoot225 TaxID=3342285 RepID=UPI003ECE66C1